MNDLSATERCVKCGLCLPHCPTFMLSGNEADSPRGRISLMQLLDRSNSELSPGLFRHLDQCLQCHACEAMCPSEVPFGELMDTARAQLEQRRQRSLPQRLARKTGLGLLRSKSAGAIGRCLISGYRTLKLDKLVEIIPVIPDGIRRTLTMLPTARLRRSPAVSGSGINGNLNLFTGCTGDLFDQATLRATQNLLGRLGYRVTTTAGQNCCGALHLHNGDPQTAALLADSNRAAFAANGDPIITFASGCSAHLLGYDRLYPGSESFSPRVIDILQFLAERDAPMTFSAFTGKVAVHIPCTHRNVLGQHAGILKLLERIPGLQPVVLNPQGGCCGAAGSYMLTQADLSTRLGRVSAAQFAASGADILLTSNIGCAMQLRAATRLEGDRVEIMHPVTLLDRLLRDDAG